MGVLSKILTQVVLTPWFLGWIGLIVVYLAVRRWWQIRKHEKALREQVAALTPLAHSLAER